MGPAEPAFVDGVADIDGGIAGFVANVADRSDAGVQKRLRDFQPLQDTHSFTDFEIVGLEGRVHIGKKEGDMCVRIHDAGHDPFVGEVNYLRIGGDGDAGADVGDLLVFDDDDLIFGDGAGGGVDEISCADGDGLGPERKCEEDCDEECESAHAMLLGLSRKPSAAEAVPPSKTYFRG